MIKNNGADAASNLNGEIWFAYSSCNNMPESANCWIFNIFYDDFYYINIAIPASKGSPDHFYIGRMTYNNWQGWSKFSV